MDVIFRYLGLCVVPSAFNRFCRASGLGQGDEFSTVLRGARLQHEIEIVPHVGGDPFCLTADVKNVLTNCPADIVGLAPHVSALISDIYAATNEQRTAVAEIHAAVAYIKTGSGQMPRNMRNDA